MECLLFILERYYSQVYITLFSNWMQNFITSSHRVIGTQKWEEIFEEISPTVNKRIWLQTISRKMNILEMV